MIWLLCIGKSMMFGWRKGCHLEAFQPVKVVDVARDGGGAPEVVDRGGGQLGLLEVKGEREELGGMAPDLVAQTRWDAMVDKTEEAPVGASMGEGLWVESLEVEARDTVVDHVCRRGEKGNGVGEGCVCRVEFEDRWVGAAAVQFLCHCCGQNLPSKVVNCDGYTLMSLYLYRQYGGEGVSIILW